MPPPAGEHRGKQRSFTEEALTSLRCYDWPGNIGELDNVVHRAVLPGAAPSIVAADLALLGTTRKRARPMDGTGPVENRRFISLAAALQSRDQT